MADMMSILLILVLLISINVSATTSICGPLTNGGTIDNPNTCTCQLGIIGNASSYSCVYTLYDVAQANVEGTTIIIFTSTTTCIINFITIITKLSNNKLLQCSSVQCDDC
jgi:hypothetical protein